MTVHRKIAKLKMILVEANSYSPSRGVNVIWLECIHEDGSSHNKGVCSEAYRVVVELVTSDRNGNKEERHDSAFLESELDSIELEFSKPMEEGKGLESVVEEELAAHKDSPQNAIKFMVIVDELEVTEYSNVSEIEILEERVTPEIVEKVKAIEEREGKTYYKFDVGVEEG